MLFVEFACQTQHSYHHLHHCPTRMANIPVESGPQDHFAGAMAGMARVLTRMIAGVGRAGIAGTVAGLTEEVTHYPWDIIKTRQQVAETNHSAWATFSQLVKKDGVKGLFKGMGAPLVMSAYTKYAIMSCIDH